MGSKGEKTRDNIIYKSLQLFTVKGYFNTSINDILEATTLTKGGLYGHFRSKEDIWYAVYDRAVSIWREIVFRGTREIENPLLRIEAVIHYNLEAYLGADIFDGGCFFFNMLAELSGQSSSMSRHILRGFVSFSKLLQTWLAEAHRKELLKADVDIRETADFIIVALNGAAPLYTASRDPQIWRLAHHQLQIYLQGLSKT
jgi:TetR/AcrR family transcriptional repressor of nem operon